MLVETIVIFDEHFDVYFDSINMETSIIYNTRRFILSGWTGITNLYDREVFTYEQTAYIAYDKDKNNTFDCCLYILSKTNHIRMSDIKRKHNILGILK